MDFLMDNDTYVLIKAKDLNKFLDDAMFYKCLEKGTSSKLSDIDLGTSYKYYKKFRKKGFIKKCKMCGIEIKEIYP